MTMLALGLAICTPATVGGLGAAASVMILSNNTVNENLASGTLVGVLSTIGTTGTPVFTLTDSAGGKFAISGANLNTAAILDYEAASSYNVIVHCTGTTPALSDQTFGIYVGDIAEVPVNSVAPTLSPTTGPVGTVLTCGQGTWSNSPSSYAYQWMNNGVDIGGATAVTYTTVAGDDTDTITCKVLATNAAGPAAGYITTSNSALIGAGWTPASLGSALRLWLKADTGITLNGSTVAAWADQSGNGLNLAQATGAKQPTYNATGLNSRPAVSFVPASDTFLLSARDAAFNLGNNTSWFIVFRVTGTSDQYASVLSYLSADGADDAGANNSSNVAKGAAPIVRWDTDGYKPMYAGEWGTSANLSASTNYRLGAILRTGGIGTMYVNNVSGGDFTFSGAPTFTLGGAGGNIGIGKTISFTSGTFTENPETFGGLISEVVVTNTALSAGERTSLDDYFKAKWGL
jgi:hypothetical protein